MNCARKHEERTISSVTEAIELMQDEVFMDHFRPDIAAIGGDENFGLWFRGQGNAQHDLTPGILRRQNGDGKDGYTEEFSFCRHYQSLNPGAVPRDATAFEWLVYMQHYLQPTRLLDWTENLLVGLFFAVRDPEKDGKVDSALWVLNGRNLNYFSSATEAQSRIAWSSDPDVIARSCLSRVLGRQEWHDVFVREVVRVRCDRPDECQQRIAEAIGDRKNVRLADDSLNDPATSPYDLRQFKWRDSGQIRPMDFYAEGRPESSSVGLYTRLRMPVAVFPERANPRIDRQIGVFTLHGGKIPQRPETASVHDDVIGRPITIEELEAMEPQSDIQARTWRSIVKWLRIPKESRASIRNDLAVQGISEAMLFPDQGNKIDDDSRYLRERWTHFRGKR
jgi:hypothetical protein